MANRSKPKNPDEAKLRELGLSLPETTEDFPWDHRALKVRGKVFVFMGTGKEGGAAHDDFFITCKLPETGTVALAMPNVKPTGYGLGKSGWVSAQYPAGRAPVAMLEEWVLESYRAVAPAKLSALLHRDGDAPRAKQRSVTPKKARAKQRSVTPKKARAKRAADSTKKR